MTFHIHLAKFINMPNTGWHKSHVCVLENVDLVRRRIHSILKQIHGTILTNPHAWSANQQKGTLVSDDFCFTL